MATEYKGAQVHLASGSWTHAVTVPSSKVSVIKLVQATNVTSSAATLNIAVSSSGGAGTQYYLAKGVSINTQASYVVVDDAVVLEATDHLVAECTNINNGIDLVVSYLQASSSVS
jgi:hypothetical protein